MSSELEDGGPIDAIEDLLDQPCEDSDVRWTRVNAAEQFPGVLSTLTWDIYGGAADPTTRGIFRAMGLLGRSESAPATTCSESCVSVRHGRFVANVDVFRDFMDRLPGNAGDTFEEQILGAKPDVARPRPRKRPLSVALNMPRALLSSGSRLRRLTLETAAWWQDWVRRIEIGGAAAARLAFEGLRERIIEVNTAVGVGAFSQQAMFGALSELLPTHKRGLMLQLASGQGLPEAEFAHAVWEYANGRATREAVITRFGHFGGEGADCARASIRAQPELLDGLVAIYRGAESPMAGVARAHARRAAIIGELIGSVAPLKRPIARWMLKQCDKLALSRELGRSAWMQEMDVARAAAYAIGADLAARCFLRSPQDAFHLTVKELLEGDEARLDATVAYRKALQAWRETFDIPVNFSGDPEIIVSGAHGPIETDASLDLPLAGLAASSGVVRGRARVIANPFEIGDFRRGDILVCRLTDPSWTPLIALAGGIVADIGGALSHGAIIARELGVPAVVNTKVGTLRIPDGALIQIDGASGEIAILEAPAPPAETAAAA